MITPVNRKTKRSITLILGGWVPLLIVGNCFLFGNTTIGLWFIPAVAVILIPIPIWVLHRINSRKLAIRSLMATPFHEGEPGSIMVQASNQSRNLIHGVGVEATLGSTKCRSEHDLDRGQTTVPVVIAPGTLKRGRHNIDTVSLHTGFPFNLFTTYQHATFNTQVLVYPEVEINAPAWPETSYESKKARMGEDIVGMREYQAGDPMRTIDWKLSAKTSSLVVREYERADHRNLVFSYEQVCSLDLEKGMKRLAAWVLRAEKSGLNYGLELDSIHICPGRGPAHIHNCLAQLAIFRGGAVDHHEGAQ